MDTRSLDLYKDALREGTEKVYSVRVMVVGQYGVGKTTLCRRLLGKDVKISDTDSTEGIDVHTECCKVFLTTGEWTTQEKNLIEIWLNSIHSCAPSPQNGIPPVILVGTHVDKIPEKFRQNVIDEYFMTIREMLGDKPAILHLMDDIAIDNTQADPRLEDLKKRIFELAKQQPHWGEVKPARWLPLEQAIITLKMSGVKVVPLNLVEEINRSGSVRIEDRDELDLFLRFQHEMGTILYFSVEGLREKIMLDPQWMINAVKSLITAETFIRRNPAITTKWLEFKTRGKLTHELLDAIWSKEKSPEFHDNKDHIILVMEKLNIIARPRTYGQDGKEVKVENYFLAPCMLSETTPQEIISPKPQKEVKSSSVLCYVFIEKYLPSPIFHRLLAACVAHWPVAQKNSENLIFCGCCVFHLDLHHRLTMFFREHIVFVRVTRMGTTEKTPSPKLCIDVKEFITMALSNVIGYLEQNLRFELCIQCPQSDGDSMNSLIPVADLQGNEDVPCHAHDVSHVIMSSEVLKFWFQEEEQSDDARTEEQKRRLKGDQDEHATKRELSKQPETLGSTRTDSDKSASEGKTGGDTGAHTIHAVDLPKAQTKRKFWQTKWRFRHTDWRFWRRTKKKERVDADKQKQKMDSVEKIYSRVSDVTTPEESQMSLQRRALPPGKKYHAFFSYSSSDIEWVRKTVKTLEENHGFVCCEYDRDNTPGTPLLKFADDSIRNAYKTVVVMTREAFQSGFVLHEIQMAMNLGFNECRNCVVPVLLEDCDVPSYLSVVNYVDARDTKRIDI